MKEKNKTLETNTIILSFGILFSKVLSLFIVPFFSRWLETEEYGKFDLCNTIIALIVPIVSFSCGEALFRLMIEAKNHQRENCIIGSSVNVYFLGDILGVIISLPICYVLLDLDLYLPFAFFLTGDMIYNFGTALARGKRDMVSFSLASIIYMIILVITSVFLVKVMGCGVKGLLISYGVAFMGSGFITLYKCRFCYRISWASTTVIKELLQYSIPTLPNTISWWIMQASDRSIIAATLGNTYNGIYAVANYLPAMCTTMFNAFHWSWQQDVSEKINDNNIKAYINKVFCDVFEGIISFGAVVVAFTFLVFKLFFSDEYNAAYNQVGILVWSAMVLFVAQFLGSIMIGLKDTRMLGGSTVIAAIVNITIDGLLINKIGLYAASLSTLFGNIVLFIIRLWLLREIISIRLKFKHFIELGLFLVVFYLYYLNNRYFNIVNLIVSIIIFTVINHKYIRNLYMNMRCFFKGWRL